MRKRLVLSGLTLVALVLPAVAADAPEVEQARMVATQVLEETKSVLEGALKGGQPAAALGVCASVAQNIARRHEQRGWRVRRVSEKVRNSADAPDAEELTVLRAWQDAHAAGRLTPDTERQEIVTARGQRYVHYMKPIFIAAPVCLQCHGAPDKLAPDVADALKLQGVPRCPRSGFPTLSHTPIAPAGLENEILSTTLVRDAGTRKRVRALALGGLVPRHLRRVLWRPWAGSAFRIIASSSSVAAEPAVGGPPKATAGYWRLWSEGWMT